MDSDTESETLSQAVTLTDSENKSVEQRDDKLILLFKALPVIIVIVVGVFVWFILGSSNSNSVTETTVDGVVSIEEVSPVTAVSEVNGEVSEREDSFKTVKEDRAATVKEELPSVIKVAPAETLIPVIVATETPKPVLRINKNAINDNYVMNLSGFVTNPGFDTAIYSDSPYIKTNLRINNEFSVCTEQVYLVGENEVIAPVLDKTTRVVRPLAMGSDEQSYLDGTWFVPAEYFDRTGSYTPRMELDCGSFVYFDEYPADFIFKKQTVRQTASTKSNIDVRVIPLATDAPVTLSYGDELTLRFTVTGLETLPPGSYLVYNTLFDDDYEYMNRGYTFTLTGGGSDLPHFSAVQITLEPGLSGDEQCTEEDSNFMAMLGDNKIDDLTADEFSQMCEIANWGKLPTGTYQQGVALLDEYLNPITYEIGEYITVVE